MTIYNNTTTSHSQQESNSEFGIANFGTIQHFKQLDVWQITKSLTVLVYKWTLAFPDKEQFGLTTQLRRAAISISSNIAEGFGRKANKDKAHFYTMARGSVDEIESQLLISSELEMLDIHNLEIGIESCRRIKMMLNALITKTTNSSYRNSKFAIRNS